MRIRSGTELLLAAGLVLLVELGPSVGGVRAATLPTDASTSYHIDSVHSGQQNDPLDPKQIQQQWTVDLGATVGYPVIADGRIFVTAGPLLYAFDLSTGNQLWGPLDIGASGHEGQPYGFLTYDAGRLFVQDGNNFLRALDPVSGQTLWLDNLPGELHSSGPPVAFNGTIYAMGNGHGAIVYAVRESDGALQWEVDGSYLNRYPGALGELWLFGDNAVVASSSGIFVDSNCGWIYKFDLNGNELWQDNGWCTGGVGKTPVLYQGRFYALDSSQAVNYILDPATGNPTGQFESSQVPAFTGSTGFFLASGALQAHDVTASDLINQPPAWSFSGDGSLDTAPLVANGYVYIGSSTGQLYALNVTTGQVAWSAPAPSGILPDESNSLFHPGMAIGQGILAVPAGNTLTVYGDATPPAGQPQPAPLPPQSFPSPTGGAGTQSSYQVDATHTGWQPADTTAPPLGYGWSRDFTTTPSTPLIAGGRAFVIAGAPGGAERATLYALDLQTGATDWTADLGPPGFASTMAYDGNKIFVVNATANSISPGYLLAYAADTGQQLWSHASGSLLWGLAYPEVAADGRLYLSGFGSAGYGVLSAVSETDGRLLWTGQTEFAGMPAVTRTGVFVTNACEAFAFNPQTGSQSWAHGGLCTGGGSTIPAAYGNAVYETDNAGVGNSSVDQLTGNLLDTYSGDRTPAFYGSLRFVAMGSTIMAEDVSTNSLEWRFAGDGSINSGPISVNGYVYVGSLSGTLYALRASDGSIAWQGNVQSAIAPDPQELNFEVGSGMAGAGNTILVPATNRLIAMKPCSNACTPVPPPPPTVTSVSPPNGYGVGGDTVVIQGSGFTGATAVTFGGTPAKSFTVGNAEHIIAASPPGSGIVDITVTTPQGASPIGIDDQFTYGPRATITSISPAKGSVRGGTRVTITGTHLSGTNWVTFGGVPASNVVSVSDTSAMATSPPGIGVVDVVANTWVFATVVAPADHFTYLEPVVVPALPSSPPLLRRSAGPPVPPRCCRTIKPSRATSAIGPPMPPSSATNQAVGKALEEIWGQLLQFLS